MNRVSCVLSALIMVFTITLQSTDKANVKILREKPVVMDISREHLLIDKFDRKSEPKSSFIIPFTKEHCSGVMQVPLNIRACLM